MRWPFLLVVFDSNKKTSQSSSEESSPVPNKKKRNGSATISFIRSIGQSNDLCPFLFFSVLVCICALCHSIKHFVTSLLNKSAFLKFEPRIESWSDTVVEERRSQYRSSTNKAQVVECGFHVDCQADCQEDTQGGLRVLQKVHSGISY